MLFKMIKTWMAGNIFLVPLQKLSERSHDAFN